MKRDIVVIGASLGGNSPLKAVLAGLPGDIQAAFFVAIHLSPDSGLRLGSIWQKDISLKIQDAVNGDAIKNGIVNLVVPDKHLRITDRGIQVTFGPRENRSRPAIDVLFRSAAVHFGPRVIGVILSGALDDGAAGLNAIERCGGTVIVQDPEETEIPEMPHAAIAATEQAKVLSVDEIISELKKEIGSEAPDKFSVPPLLQYEEDAYARITQEEPRVVMDPKTLTCPECGGPLEEFRSPTETHYRCIVGHSFSTNDLLRSHDRLLERSMWSAARVLRERAALFKRMAEKAEERGSKRLSVSFLASSDESKEESETIIRMLKRHFGTPPQVANY